jgi:hypothetical protein
MIRKFIHPLAAVTLALGIAAGSVQPAEAGRGGRFVAGVAAGAIGVGILGALAHSRAHAHYHGGCFEVGGGCYWREGRCYIDRFGREICRRGYRVCEPARVVCD